MTTDNDPEHLGGLAGLAAGMLTGAQLGTVALPIPLVGTFTGALLGGMLGSRVGRQVARPLLEALSLASPGATHPGASVPSLSARLDELRQLRADGVLTEEEYRSAVARLVSRP